MSYLPFPAGVYVPYGGTTAPSGWLLCYGQAVSRTTYAELFAAISTAYGVGDGSTTFNVPDLRGRFPLGKDNMGGSSANRVTATQADNLGQANGAESHTLTTGEIPAHNHTITPATVTGLDLGTPGANGFGAGFFKGSVFTTANAGSGGAHNIMNPYQTGNYIIKT